jgi:hypothetical protein
LGIELQPSLLAAIRTTLTDPALTRSAGEFHLTLEVIGHVLPRDDLSSEGGQARRFIAWLLGLVIGRYVLRLPVLVEPPD